MKRIIPKWASKLNRKEIKHLEKMDANTLKRAKRTFAHQAIMRKNFPNGSEPCWECRFIAKKLGFPV